MAFSRVMDIIFIIHHLSFTAHHYIKVSVFDEIRRKIPEALRKERYRFQTRLRALEQNGHVVDVQKLSEEVSRSAELVEKRRASVPRMQYDQDLPVCQERERIAEAIRRHQVVVVCGETGSGKSTQLPKICLEMGFGVSGMIGHTQPRRIAASSITHRLQQEIPGGKGLVGYKIRFTDHTSPETCVKLMTDGILLAESQGDRNLDQYDVIIIDEAHERSLNIDFLIGILRRVVDRRNDLKVIITSATIDAQRFAEHFRTPAREVPVIEVSGRTYPVEVLYEPLVDEDEDDGGGHDADAVKYRDLRDADIHQGVVRAISRAAGMGQGDMLVFMPTERDIHEVVKMLHGEKQRRQGAIFTGGDVEVLPLYARLPASEQQRIFDPGPKRRIVIATNVAESSVTVPRIRYVIDTGTARISRYSARTKMQRLPVEPISQASADQRKGRCGRIGPGVCIRLYSEADFNRREKYTQPEIQRTNLASVILQTKVFRLGQIETFPFIDPPRKDAIRDGYKTLFEIGALTEAAGAGEVTELGRRLSRLPVDPRIGRMILESVEEAKNNGGTANPIQEVLVIAAALEIRDPRERPVEHQAAADTAHTAFLDARSDFVGLLRLWNFYHHLKATLSRNQLLKACRQNFLSWNRMREWTDMYHQFSELVQDMMRDAKFPAQLLRGDVTHLAVGDGVATNVAPEKYNAIHRAILSGMLANIGRKAESSKEYAVGGGGKCFLWPGSGVVKQCVSGPSVSSGNAADTTVPPPRGPKAGTRFFGRKLGADGTPMDSAPSFPNHKPQTTNPTASAAQRRPLPAWLVAAEMVETTKRYLRTVAEIDPEWAETLAPHLVSRTYSSPHWSKSNNAVMVYEKVTLFGLPIIPKRRVAYAKINPTDARELFLRHGLVEGLLTVKPLELPFYTQNRELLTRLEQLQAKLRRHDFIPGDWKLYDFYDSRLPMEVYDLPTLKKWLAHLKDGTAQGPDGRSGDATITGLNMTEADVLAETLDRGVLQLFPDTLPGISADASFYSLQETPETPAVTHLPAPVAKTAEPKDAAPTDTILGVFTLFGKKAELQRKPTPSPSKTPPTPAPKSLPPPPKTSSQKSPTPHPPHPIPAASAASAAFPLEYRFEPGTAEDGVTVQVTLETVNQVDPRRLAWGIPGLFEERIAALIKSLPKDQRRKLVPAPDTARLLREKIPFGRGDFLRVLAAELTRLAGEPIHPDDLKLDEIPAELQMNIRVVDREGKTLAENRSYDEILRAVGQRTAERFEAIHDSRWRRDGITAWDFGELPVQVTVRAENAGASQGKGQITAYPMLVDAGKSVNLRLANTLFHAESATRRAAIRLFRLAANKELLQQAAWLPGVGPMKSQAFSFISATGLPLESTLADALASAACTPEGISSLADLPSLLRNVPRDKAQFDKLCRDARSRVPLVVQDIGTPLAALWKAYQTAVSAFDSLCQKKGGVSPLIQTLKLGSATAQLPQNPKNTPTTTPPNPKPQSTNLRLQPTVDDISRQLARLMPADFLLTTSWQRLRHYPRYLHGIASRIETLKNANSGQHLALEAQRIDELESFWQRYETLRNDFHLRGLASPELDEFRWLLEEYRVSLFAQKLGTAVPVSAKRLERMWGEMQK